MRQKHTIVRHGNMFLCYALIIPAVCIVISFLPGAESGRAILLALTSMVFLGECVCLRKVLILALSRVTLDEKGVAVKIPFCRCITMRWKDINRCVLCEMRTLGGLYDQQWICFLNKEITIPSSIESLRSLNLPNERCVYMTYSEFAWDIITEYSREEAYCEAIFRSKDVV